ncbi:glutathione-regulated potassium-efflux system protein KefC [Variibacter gotjawalensis]|uniref:Glutathione-regulated potassium-efflux system protein KefC n=1 Tax=Variibacter gotjawalensis TaxID=1333996 RepID=A0A0S3PTE6_9BRAD|nr:monovalent cation:proton antiporter-2 (CPA2) family protein [Variibacter gotjawalensis]NIK49485.1 glutathione-regulated potassium-efflux system protein KefB [Variibacter gotjawalensis]RZS51337.1 Kef-type potassium/proton antiporter (CPA2 family) [Variibacter gotjawalensis]BAT59170.1 glutathione-regulated potassium-efflux system protein KefC [Variibacter gotjawalensis]
MAAETGFGIETAVALLGAGVVAVPIFRKAGLGSVLGYLAAGLAIGPFGLRVVSDPLTLLHVGELGVVLFLFVIGLEMRPSKLWNLRGEIFGLGVAQVVTCSLLLTGLAHYVFGLSWAIAAVGAAGFVLSSTAVIMQMLDETNELSEPSGQRAVSILLLEDLAIVPLLAAVAVWAALNGKADANAMPVWQSVGLAGVTVALVIAAGRWLLDPFFALLARAGAREVMTAAALLVVLGTAVLMQRGGLSMAMGAFLAGVLLSESTFRHQLEVDIEPFRGILLGLFFISVGMALDLSVVVNEWKLVIAGVLSFMIVKALGIFGVARLFGATNDESLRRSALFAQGGEFAFVLYASALAVGMIDQRNAAVLSAIVILSMALTPLVLIAERKLVKPPAPSMDGIDRADGLKGRVLVIGFGRFAQIAAQALLTQKVEVSLIETDVEMIRAAGRFGFKVHYGDGTRLDVLRASGAETAEAILVCVDKPDAADHIVELVRAEFPHAKLFVRAFDRGHSLRLIKAGVEFQVRETFESALTFGRTVLTQLGVTEEEADDIVADVRRRDEERLELQVVSGIEAGRSLIRGNMPTPVPEPFVKPRVDASKASPDAALAAASDS